jgi:two-component system sensor histidine kinase RegB
LEFSNLPLPATGASIRITWLRAVFERDDRPAGPSNAELLAPYATE